MLWLAVTTLEKLQAVPTRFWVNLAIGLAGFVSLVLLLRFAAKINKFVLALLIFLMLTVVGFQWIYERNEPSFLTPTIDKVAPFFPSKPEYREYKPKI